jgi:RNA recognition motif-containing protein
MKKIYVGNLSFDCDDRALADTFTEHGEVVSAKVVMDRDTNRSRGFGFVEMSDDSAAMKAIEALNGKEVGGRALNVNEARPREPRTGGGSRW